jgi:hypothetical protein
MKTAIVFIISLLMCSMAEAACPAGSTCTQYDGLTPYTSTGGTTSRKDVDRANDRGINILEFGADPTGVSDSTSAIQSAIDYSINSADNRAVICPAGTYKTTYPLFLDAPNSLRGTATAWNSGTAYTIGQTAKYLGLQWQAATAMTGLTKVSNGTGYVANEVLLLTGGSYFTPTIITVNTVSVGAISTFTISTAGQYTADGGTYNVTSLTGVGTGATFNAATYGTNTNHTPSGDLAINTNPVWWTPTTATPSSTSFNGSFSWQGALALSPGSNAKAACILQPTFNNAPAFWVGPGNGNIVQGLDISSSTNETHRCQQPVQGIGIAVSGGSSGASRTKLENVGTSGFYVGISLSATTTDALADSNSIIKSTVDDACYGVVANHSQAFINDIQESNMNANIGIRSTLGTGFNVYGGNYSSTGANARFTIGSVTASIVSNTVYVTATLSTPGSYFTNAMCYSNVQISTPFTPAQCFYNMFSIVTTNNGIVPFQLVGFFCSNPPTCSTNTIMLKNLVDWWNPFGNTLGSGNLTTDIAAQTTLYASEAPTTFYGSGFNVQGIHIENFMGATSAATTLLYNSTQFGNSRANHLKSIYFNYDPSTKGATGDNLSAYYNSQEFPFIYSDGQSAIVIDDIIGAAGEYLMIDSRAPARMIFNNIPETLWKFNTRSVAIVGANPFTANYTTIGTQGLGFGEWDNPDPFTSMAYTSPDSLRASGWMKSPFWGYRPAPWSRPCLTPAQITTLAGSLPAITNTGSGGSITYTIGYPLMWGGQQYQACDWNSPSHNSVVSSHKFYSYGQALTTSNVPNLSATLKRLAPNLYMNVEAMRLMFPGLGISLVCNSLTKLEIVTEVHYTAGYVTLMDANQDGSPYISDFGQDCTFTTLGQTGYTLTQF